jgi:hypothetical protein
VQAACASATHTSAPLLAADGRRHSLQDGGNCCRLEAQFQLRLKANALR